jgi:hypothetical protein
MRKLSWPLVSLPRLCSKPTSKRCARVYIQKRPWWCHRPTLGLVLTSKVAFHALASSPLPASITVICPEKPRIKRGEATTTIKSVAADIFVSRSPVWLQHLQQISVRTTVKMSQRGPEMEVSPCASVVQLTHALPTWDRAVRSLPPTAHAAHCG